MRNDNSQSELLHKGSESQLTDLLGHLHVDEPFDAALIFLEHSSLRDSPSLMVDIAYEDYWRKLKSGENIDPDVFAATFPHIRDRLRHMIDIGELINQSPKLLLNLMQPVWPEVPAKVGSFELIKQIAEGSFSRVYLARDQLLGGRQITLKVTRHALREAEALGRLHHPNIISPLGLYEDVLPGLAVMAMPFCGRATLSDLIDARPTELSLSKCFDLSGMLRRVNGEFEDLRDAGPSPLQLPFINIVIGIGAQLAAGLAYAHSCGICHCDIKPSNILLNQKGIPLLLDFNLSVFDQHISYAGGTLSYMAPEQLEALGSAASLTGAADVYSLGATLIELLQGTPPFGKLAKHTSTGQPFSHPLQRNKQPFRFEEEIRQHLGERLAGLLESCLTFDPAKRPTSEKLAFELQCLDRSKISRRFFIPRRAAISISMLSIFAITAGGAWSLITTSTIEQQYELGLNALVQENRGSTAVRHFSHILRAAPTRVDVKILQICGMIQNQDWEKSSIELSKLNRECENPELNALHGYVLCRWNQQNKLAEYEYQVAYDKGLCRPGILNNLALCKIRANKLTEATALLESAIRIAPKHPQIVINRAKLEIKACSQFGRNSNIEVADAILANHQLSNDRGSLLTAAQIYLLDGTNSTFAENLAIRCIRKGIEFGLCKDEILNLLESIEQRRHSAFVQLLNEAPVSSPIDDGIDYFISPPLTNRDYLQELLRSVAPKYATHEM